MTKSIIASNEEGWLSFERMRRELMRPRWERNSEAGMSYHERVRARERDIEQRRRIIEGSIRP